MTADIRVFWGEPPAERSEAEFLAQLREDLARRDVPAIILANYFTASSSRQVDFFVITATHACHVELKRYPPLLIGGTNGPWSVRRADGTVEEIDRSNPYTQALGCKMAISDDMSAFARQDSSVPQSAPGREFYRQIDSVVCIFPRLDEQSQVPDDYKVRTMGYAQLVGFLTGPGEHPGWSAGHWAALACMLNLADAGKPPSPEPGRTAAQDRVRSYLRSFRDFYTRDLHELVPLPLVPGEGRLPDSGLLGVLQQHQHVQLAGPTGTGKTHLARHLMASIVDGPLVPVLIEGTMYEGRLSPLLDRAVAAFTTASPRDLQLAAAIGGQVILLVVDGFNECPQPLQERLLRDLSSYCRRSQAVTLITTQIAVTMPSNLAGTVVSIGTLTAEDRRAILSSYGAPEITSMCEPFTTAYELAIAAECAGELFGKVTRASLLSAFVRRRLRTGAHPAHTRGALRQLALAMDAELAASLSIGHAERTVEQYLADHSAPRDVLDEALDSSITASQHGRVTFTHELLGRFLAAEALLLGGEDLPSLLEALRSPRHEDLAPMAVSLESDVTRAGALLSGLASSRLYTQALRGESGAAATRAARLAAHQFLQAETHRLASVTFTVRPEYQLSVTGGHELSAADQALLAATGALAHEGLFLREVMQLLDATDIACRRSAQTQARSEGLRPTASTTVATVLAGIGGAARSQVPAAIILAATELTHIYDLNPAHNRRPRVSNNDIAAYLSAATPDNHGRLLLLASFLTTLQGMEAAALALRLLRICIDSDAYHVQLEGLNTIRTFVNETSGTPLGQEIADYLQSTDLSGNLGLSTLHVEILNAYGLIDFHYDGDLSAEIEQIIQSPVDDDSIARAHSIISNQFEEVIGEPFYTAVESLDPADKVRLYTIAALGPPTPGLTNDWLLRELAKSADRAALPALQHWATQLELSGFYPQGSTACYLLAMQGCALHMDTPPQLASCQTDDQAAWQCYGAIVFWLDKSGLSDKEVTAQCAPHWQQLTGALLPAAADPLVRFYQASGSYDQDGQPVFARIILRFPAEACQIMQWSIQRRDTLTSVFPSADREDRARTIIDMLGIAGSTETVDLLYEFTDDQALGRAAVAAIKQLTDHRSRTAQETL
jgi:hypothetical protein